MGRTAEKVIGRSRRHKRIRKNVSGTSERPRLNVFRSAKHIYCQIVDDSKGITLVSASTLDKEILTVSASEPDKEMEAPVLKKKGKSDKAEKPIGKKTIAAKKAGAVIAKKALEKGIKKVVLDRGGYLYHGRVKALAEAARKGGLEF